LSRIFARILKVQVVNKGHFDLPKYQTSGSAGLDLHAALDKAISLKPLERRLIPTGLSIALPEGTEAQIRPRSGLALKHGLSILNTPGTIDSDYRGELKVLLVNLSNEVQQIEAGERIAQMVVAKFEQVEWEGRGTRMRPHTITTPKPLIPIAGKPMVHRIVEDIASTIDQKIEEIAFIVGRFGEQAEKDLLEVATSFGAKGKIYYQDEPLGTAHALMCAKESLEGPVFIAFSDTLFKANFTVDANKDAIIWTHKVDNPSAFGVVKLKEDGSIEEFIEKPQEFVSDLAIIGVYYFKDGANLRSEMQFLLDNKIMGKGEYQLTDAMETMRSKGVGFYTDQVDEWLDCGNKDNTLYTMERIVENKVESENFLAKDLVQDNSCIIQPCFIGPGVSLKNAVVGPHVSLEEGSTIENAVISKSIVGKNSLVKNCIITNSLLGNNVDCQSQAEQLSLGDYSFKV